MSHCSLASVSLDISVHTVQSLMMTPPTPARNKVIGKTATTKANKGLLNTNVLTLETN